jgi:broad specificity phosphatase PhoE
MKLLLIRHGQSVANAEGRIQGQFDSPLNDQGRDQARALARRLQREGRVVKAIYASDLSRAAETAEILAAAVGAPLTTDDRLREYDIGVLNGVVWREVEFLYPDIWHGWHHSSEWVSIPGEEGNRVFYTRIVSMLDDIRAQHGEDEMVALVSHGGTLGMMLAHLLGMNPDRPTPFRFDNTSLSIVELGPRGPRLTLMNDTGHLDGKLR